MEWQWLLKQGFCQVRSEGKSSPKNLTGKWRTRWVILKEDGLYFSKGPLGETLASVPLHRAVICCSLQEEWLVRPNQKYVTAIIFNDYQVHIASPDGADCRDWTTLCEVVRNSAYVINGEEPDSEADFSDTKLPVFGEALIEVVEAKDLAPKDFNGLSDPLAIVTAQGQTFQTDTKDETLYPTWNEKFRFDLRFIPCDIYVVLYDKDEIGSDDFLGWCQLPLHLYSPEEQHDLWLPLRSRKEKDMITGEVHLRFSFKYRMIELTTTARKMGPIFGQPLDSVMCRLDHQGCSMPSIVKKCISFLYRNALDSEGIFRLSGSKFEIDAFKKSFDIGENVKIPDDTDPNIVAGLLKQYLRELPEPLMTMATHDKICSASPSPSSKDFQQQLTFVTTIVSSLPQVNLTILKAICTLLYFVWNNKDKTLMGVSNLGIVFGPALCMPHQPKEDSKKDKKKAQQQPATLSPDSTFLKELTEIPLVNSFASFLIQHTFEVFSIEDESRAREYLDVLVAEPDVRPQRKKRVDSKALSRSLMAELDIPQEKLSDLSQFSDDPKAATGPIISSYFEYTEPPSDPPSEDAATLLRKISLSPAAVGSPSDFNPLPSRSRGASFVTPNLSFRKYSGLAERLKPLDPEGTTSPPDLSLSPELTSGETSPVEETNHLLAARRHRNFTISGGQLSSLRSPPTLDIDTKTPPALPPRSLKPPPSIQVFSPTEREPPGAPMQAPLAGDLIPISPLNISPDFDFGTWEGQMPPSRPPTNSGRSKSFALVSPRTKEPGPEVRSRRSFFFSGGELNK